jgi:hypothetical protein
LLGINENYSFGVNGKKGKGLESELIAIYTLVDITF